MKAPAHLRIEEIRLPPGQEWTNDEAGYRFVCVSSGSAYWLDPAKPRAFSEGELAVVAPSLPAVVRASQLNEVVLHWFRFAPDLLSGFFTLAERQLFEIQPTAGNRIQFLPSTHPLTQRLRAVVSRRQSNQELLERTEVLGLVAAFFTDEIKNLPATDRLPTSAGHRFHQIISQMPELELIQHSAEQLARLCGCSTRHFNRLFRQQFGQSPRARQTELRLLKASQLLCDTEEKIVQVALESGYQSLSLFNSLFRRRFGVSPIEWRKQNRS
jgi:AraC-like DNA-binding protein